MEDDLGVYKDVLLKKYKVNYVAGIYVDFRAITFSGLMTKYCNIALTLESVNETLQGDHSNETSLVVF